VDITGTNQHSFKKKSSKSTLTTMFQSKIARALKIEGFVILESLDLSLAFDLVDIKQLKRLRIVGLPQDIIRLFEVWFKERSFYISIDGTNSVLLDLLLGTVQGSMFGIVRYAIFV
jgi:hypothetical protein